MADLLTFRAPELVGKQLIFAGLGLLLRYEYSFISPLDDQLYHGGVIVDKLPGVGFELGCAWAWKASEMKVWEGTTVC